MTFYKTKSTKKPIMLAVTFLLSASIYTASAFAAESMILKCGLRAHLVKTEGCEAPSCRAPISSGIC